jgi:hypothetical protein
MNALSLSTVTVIVISVWVLVDLGGWTYYQTPLRVRGYAAAHALLRPSGSIGHPLGIAGMLMMCMPYLYSLRKKATWMARFGSPMVWLDMHIFCGIVGPVLVTFHTAFKFNGIVSVAFWSMVLVMASGFVGRYFYVRIPKSIRGAELSYEEIFAEAGRLQACLIATGLSADLIERVEAFENAVSVPTGHLSVWTFLFGHQAARRRLAVLRRDLRAGGVESSLLDEIVRLADRRMVLLARLAYLRWSKAAFAMWHLFHKPLVWLMLVIAVLHVGAALYLGYLPHF